MSLLFFLDKNRRAILHRDCINLCPSLSTLNDEEVLYVILYADYNSPHRQLPEHQRKIKAMFEAFGQNEPDIIESSRILIAVEDYISLQYSPKIEAAKEYQKKIDSLLDSLKEENTPGGIKKLDDAIDVLRKRIRTFEQEYEQDMQSQGIVKGKMELSFLEKIQANKNQWNGLKQRQPKL